MSSSTQTQRSSVSIAQSKLSADDSEQLARKLKALAEPTRLQLLNMIAQQGEMCVCDMNEPLNLSQPTISHHLKVLADAGIVHRSQRGKWAYFRIDHNALQDLANSLAPSDARGERQERSFGGSQRTAGRSEPREGANRRS